MPGSIESLQKPAPEDDPALAPPHPITGQLFEKRLDAWEEDRRRQRWIMAAADQGHIDPGRPQMLAHRLDLGLNGEAPTPSPACSLYMRGQRRRIIGELQVLHRTWPLQTFTLIPHRWLVPAGELDSFDPVKRLAAIRSLLNRAGASQADGFLITFLHGEFEPESATFQLHLHGAAHGEMVEVLDSLREGLKHG